MKCVCARSVEHLYAGSGRISVFSRSTLILFKPPLPRSVAAMASARAQCRDAEGCARGIAYSFPVISFLKTSSIAFTASLRVKCCPSPALEWPPEYPRGSREEVRDQGQNCWVKNRIHYPAPTSFSAACFERGPPEHSPLSFFRDTK